MFYLAMFLLNSTSISGKIERIVQQGTKKQVFSGNILFNIPDIFYLHLYSPINQIFFIKKDSLFIYYPVDKRAFKGIVRNPMNNPLFNMMIGTNKRIDLTPYHFRFLRKITKGDTIYSEWVENKKGIPVVKIGRLNGKQISFEIDGKDKKLLAKTEYKKHIKAGKIYFPVKTYSIIILPNDTLKETVEYSDIMMDSLVPDSVKNFHFPEGIKVEILNL